MGLQSKQLGFLECLAWHLFEIGELLPLGLPTGPSKQALLSQAIEVSSESLPWLQCRHDKCSCVGVQLILTVCCLLL